MERKKRTQSWHRKKALELAKKIAVIRDRGVCQRCGKSKEQGFSIHGSHVKSVGSYPKLSATLINIKALCYYCHYHWWHKEPTEAGKWFESKFPKRMAEINRIIKENKDVDWELVHNQLKEKLKEYESWSN